MHKVGLSTGYGVQINDESLEKLRKSGFEAIEVTLGADPYLDYKQAAEIAKRHDIILWSSHIPFRPFEERDVSIEDPIVRGKFVEYIKERIKSGSEVGIERFVIHPSIPLPEDRRAERKKCAMDSFSKLAPVAKECGAVICVEDMILSCLGNSVDELEEIISVDDSLRVCFDVNHLLNNTHKEFLDRLGHKIATMHISDYDFVQERHVWPGRGKINWPELYKMVCDAGYKGVWMYEVGMKYKDREGTFDELYNLTMDIFSGKQPNP